MSCRTTQLDADNRRNPRTDIYCVRCHKDLKPGAPRREIRCGRDLSRTGLSIWLAHLRLALSNMAEEIREAREKAGKP